MTRQAKLQALIDHPDTGAGEREAARAALRRLPAEPFTVAPETLRSPPRAATAPPAAPHYWPRYSNYLAATRNSCSLSVQMLSDREQRALARVDWGTASASPPTRTGAARTTTAGKARSSSVTSTWKRKPTTACASTSPAQLGR